MNWGEVLDFEHACRRWGRNRNPNAGSPWTCVPHRNSNPFSNRCNPALGLPATLDLRFAWPKSRPEAELVVVSRSGFDRAGRYCRTDGCALALCDSDSRSGRVPRRLGRDSAGPVAACTQTLAARASSNAATVSRLDSQQEESSMADWYRFSAFVCTAGDFTIGSATCDPSIAAFWQLPHVLSRRSVVTSPAAPASSMALEIHGTRNSPLWH